jgi:hypothetical protein
MNTADDIKDFPVVKAKTPTQLRIDELQRKAREVAKDSAIREEVIEIPPDVDTTRLAEIAKELVSTTTLPLETIVSLPLETITSFKDTFIPDTPIKYDILPLKEGTMRGLVISVTTISFTPMRTRANEQPSISIQKYHVLIETSQPLQLGKEYQIIL